MRVINEPSNAIRPDLIAGKIASIRNRETLTLVDQVAKEPRLLEMLWFLQWKDLQPGGLEGFAKELIERFPERIGTTEMRAAKTRPGAKLTLNQWREIYLGLPECVQNDLVGADAWAAEAMLLSLDGGANGELENEILWRLRDVGAAGILDSCRETAVYRMPGYFRRLCNEPEMPFPEPSDSRATWFFHDLAGAVLKMMDEHANQIRKRLASTEVSIKVLDALRYAREESILVRIDGDSRFGKSETVHTDADMYPGRARIVRVPCSNSEHDLHKAVYKAIFMTLPPSGNRVKVKETVEYIIQNGGLFLIFDEAHFLVPCRFTETTPPMRLNWVRTQIVDEKLPCAIVTTPQSFNPAMQRFVRKTGHTMEQFLGRTMFTVSLPSELSGDDLMLVAKSHFPQLDEDFLMLIVAKALQSESYLKAVEQIATRARYLARRDDHKTVTVKDVETAIYEVFPHLAAPAPEPIRRRIAAGLQSRSKRPATPVPKHGLASREDNLAGQNRLEPESQTDTELHSALSLANG